jgi:alpha-glucosidase (family GH31 glycosyl hydrolase)
MNLSGLAYMHSDAGGFSNVPEGDPELYTRWLQFATFTPIFRPHADEVVPSEPVFWDEETQQIVKEYIRLRYAMLPYNYTLAWSNSRTGYPMSRPMFLDYPEVSDSLFQQYMWGESFLVAPVVDQGATSKFVYLPDETWYNFHTGERIEENGGLLAEVDIDEIPVFVKGGSVIPMAPGIRNAGNYSGDTLRIQYYFIPEASKGLAYFDDGQTPRAYDKNLYQILKWDISGAQDELIITLTTEGNGYDAMPGKRVLEYWIYGLSKAPSRVGVDIDFQFEEGILKFWSDTSQEQLIVEF